MLIATHIKSGKAFEGYVRGFFFFGREIGTDNTYSAYDKVGFTEMRNWTKDDYEFQLKRT